MNRIFKMLAGIVLVAVVTLGLQVGDAAAAIFPSSFSLNYVGQEQQVSLNPDIQQFTVEYTNYDLRSAAAVSVTGGSCLKQTVILPKGVVGKPETYSCGNVVGVIFELDGPGSPIEVRVSQG